MFNWFKQKKYPEYWLAYSNHFKKKKLSLNEVRFVVFDTETTGFHPTKDKILSIGAISIIGNSMDVADSFEAYLRQEEFNRNTVEIHGILKEGSIKKISEEEAMIQFLEYIKDAVLIAHHTAFDLGMINEALKRLELPLLKNKSMDTGILFKKINLHKAKDKPYSLDELCYFFQIKKHDRHTASGDAFLTGIIFLKIISRLKDRHKNLSLKDLLFVKPTNGLI